MLLDDHRFGFIAKTEEELARFRQADIVLAGDAKTGTCVVVFGRERVQRARDSGDKEVPALVVRFNPDTAELERLAAACLVLKGRHDLPTQRDSESSCRRRTHDRRDRGQGRSSPDTRLLEPGDRRPH